MSKREEAVALKQKGNKSFANHEWLDAISFYDQAIDLYNEDPSFFCNRAQVVTSARLVYDLYMSRPADVVLRRLM